MSTASLAVRNVDVRATEPEAIAPAGQSLDRAIDAACRRIAPLWPLKHFVAVNPFLGFSGQTFAATCSTMRRVTGAEMLMPRDFHRDALASGRIDDADLAAGLRDLAASMASPPDIAACRRALADRGARPAKRRPAVATVADVLDALAGGDRHASRTAFMVDEISRWCAAYFDEGPAAWKMPSRGLAPYPAWREAMRFDRNPEMFGIREFRDAVRTMPDDPRETIAVVVDALGIPAHALEDYLYRALFDIAGWAGHLRYLAWDNALHGREDDRLVDLLAIRVVWGYALFRERRDPAFTAAWANAIARAASSPRHAGSETDPEIDPELAIDLALQHAYEAATQRRLIARIASQAGAAASPSTARKAVQAVFCIDVRSEIFRRALETASPETETLGFAGFFGFPIEYVPLGRTHGEAQCPVLLKPGFTVCEAVAGASVAEEAELLQRRTLRQRVAKAWTSFKLSAVSSFTFVETGGLAYAARILGDATGRTRSVPPPSSDGLDAGTRARIVPRLAPGTVAGRASGFDHAQRVALAEGVLRAMSMTGDFARLVLLAGHGSSTVNNPYATGLDCGACGGHTGEANARVAAGLLNDPELRDALRARGIAIPDDTWFIAGLHDTTTDVLRLFDTETVPAALAPDLLRLREDLDRAGALARMERSALLGIRPDADIDAAIAARSRDWAQVRPEWGLAGNAAFIAAPRERTRGLDLGGRAFLHSYDWRKDSGFGVLELIMTAPMVVASWINLQYYGSTVDNRAFGAGNKVLHNVVGGIGVLEGNAGDLKVGLPWQSVHDGERFVHEPVRLNVFIAAPIDAINAVIARHERVRELVDHHWLHLFALDDDGRVSHRYRGALAWSAP
ncbi:MAG: YbcC family protein [Lysobacteraceae bacterium]